MSYPTSTKGMYVCEDRVTRARVSVPVLRYTYIHVYTRVYIVITCPSICKKYNISEDRLRSYVADDPNRIRCFVEVSFTG